MRQIEVNLATQDLLDRRFLNFLMAITVAVILIITAFSGYRYIGNRKQLRMNEVRIERARQQAAMTKQQQQQQAQAKSADQRKLRQLSVRIGAVNSLIARDAFPWNRFLDQLERMVPEGLRIETLLLGDQYDRLTMTGRADAAHKITFFLRRLEEWRLIRTIVIRGLGLPPSTVSGAAAGSEGELWFKVESEIAVENLFDSRMAEQMGRLLKSASPKK